MSKFQEEEIESLVWLKARGLISNEEFHQRKAALFTKSEPATNLTPVNDDQPAPSQTGCFMYVLYAVGLVLFVYTIGKVLSGVSDWLSSLPPSTKNQPQPSFQNPAMVTFLGIACLILLLSFLYFFFKSNKQSKVLAETTATLIEKTQKVEIYSQRYSGLIDVDEAIDTAKAQLFELNTKYQAALGIFKQLEEKSALYENNLELIEYGLYSPQFNFDTSEVYRDQIEANYAKQKQCVKNDEATKSHIEWTVGDSKVEGRKMINRTKKLMLFAFNGECDSIIVKTRWNNAAKMKERINKAFDSVNKLGEPQRIEITIAYLGLKLQELALTHEYELKKQEEKEEQRRIREELREEEKARFDYEKAQKEATEEERRFQKALDKARSEMVGASQLKYDALLAQVNNLEVSLKEAQERKERAVSMAQLTKAGHIYVISNIGSFGEDVYKIGMTRRLEPLDRVHELGDASVPFRFDVHAIIYSENAPQLEYELHKQFADRRLNMTNYRREFFKVSLQEIETFILGHTGNAEIEFFKIAEAKEYRETLALMERLNQPIDLVKIESAFPDSLI